jgi:DNA-binding CsgD family transcriptional regulator
MVVVSPVWPNEPVTFQSRHANEVVQSIGTERYSKACFELFEQPLDVDQLALFRYNHDASVNCIAQASRSYTIAAKEAINWFLERCYSVDPSLSAVKFGPRHLSYVVRTELSDIRDRQYRHCYDSTHVQERLSFFLCVGSDFYQLSVFRRIGKRPFSDSDTAQFSALAKFAVTTAIKHETFRQMARGLPHYLDLEAIERLLHFVPGNLSKREIEVCARVVAGMTIEKTAIELAIKRTSVVTYRQRAYEKLNISRQNELVALINNLRSNGIGCTQAA